MNLYKSKIIKSEAVKIVERKEESLYAGGGDASSPAPAQAGITQEKLEKAMKGAYEKGVGAGLNKGRELQRLEYASAVKAAEDAVRQAGRLKAAIIEKSENDILELVFAIAEKVIHQEVTTNREIVRGILKKAVEAVRGSESIRVRCNPADLACLVEMRPDLMGAMDGINNVEFVEDPAIVKGGVRVETATGEVDARIDSQFGVIRKEVLS